MKHLNKSIVWDFLCQRLVALAVNRLKLLENLAGLYQILVTKLGAINEFRTGGLFLDARPV